MKFNHIVVIDPLNITDEAQKVIQTSSSNQVVFPDTEPKDEPEIITKVKDADAIFVSWKTPVTKKIIESANNLKYIGVCATSLANIDLETAKAKGTTVTNVIDYGDEATAEYIFTQLLVLARGLGKYQWQEMPVELNGKTIGIVGLGAVGAQVARLALGFNMKVLYYSRTRKPEWENQGLIYTELDDLITQSDIVTLHVPKNTMILTKEKFDLLTKGKILVTTPLGKVYNETDFIDWIKKGENFAIFDYSVSEDYYKTFKNLPNVIFPQIIAGRTKESKIRLSNKVIKNLQEFLVTPNEP